MKIKKPKGKLLKTLLYASAITGASLFLPSTVQPVDLKIHKVKYFPYELPSKDFLEELVQDSTYPEKIDLRYEIPYNKDGLTGMLSLKRDSSGARIKVDFDQEKESKLISFLREDSLYKEGDKDRKHDKEYSGKYFIPKTSTVIDLVEGFILNENYLLKEFESKNKKYEIKMQRQEVKDGFILKGEIKNNNPKVTNIEIHYRKINEKIIPVEFILTYKIKAKDLGFLGCIWNPIKIRAVLKGYNFD